MLVTSTYFQARLFYLRPVKNKIILQAQFISFSLTSFKYSLALFQFEDGSDVVGAILLASDLVFLVCTGYLFAIVVYNANKTAKKQSMQDQALAFLG